jgi:hypothetical protein
MARCSARLFFFLAFLASEYLSADRTVEESCCLGLFSGAVASAPEVPAAVMSIFNISLERACKELCDDLMCLHTASALKTPLPL